MRFYGYAIYGYAIYGHAIYGHTVLRFYRITQQPYKLIIDTLSAYSAIGLRYDSEWRFHTEIFWEIRHNRRK